MKPYLLLPVVLFVQFSLAQSSITFSDSDSIFVNELHYDNVGLDSLEGIEIASVVGVDLSCYIVYLINGYNGNYYATIVLDSIQYSESCGIEYRHYLKSSIQNGSSTEGDGLLLYNLCDSSVVQFISYEGVVVANNGLFVGAVSQDIGVFQNSDALVTSLQLQGSIDTSFQWVSDVASFGEVNNSQNFCANRLELSHLYLDTSCVLSENEEIILHIKNISFSNTTDSTFLFFQTNDSVVFSDTLYQSLGVGDSLEFTFSQTLDLSQSGDFSFKVWAMADTSVVSDTSVHHIHIFDDDSLDIQLNEDVVFCHNEDSLILNAQVSGADYYSWNTGDSTQQLVIFPTADTSFYFFAHNLCYRDTVAVEVNYLKPEINFIGIISNGSDTLFVEDDFYIDGNVIYVNKHIEYYDVLLTILESFESYLFYYRVPNASMVSHHYDSILLVNTSTEEDGSSAFSCNYGIETYIVMEGLDSYGCFAKDSVIVFWFFVNILEQKNHTFSLYPNTSRGMFSIAMHEVEPLEYYAVEIINSICQLVESQKIHSTGSNMNQNFDLSHLKKGYYHLWLKSKNQQAHVPLILY
jgi:hypothetical protein